MMESHIKEGLSKAYAIAVAHKAGMNFAIPDFDYGIDGIFRDIQFLDGRYCDNSWSIDIQLKSTINIIDDGEYIKYDLEVKNYNDLVATDVGGTRILVLFVLPDNQDEWLNISEEGTILKNCAWWCSFKGQNPTTNNSKVRVTIPKNQLLTATSLREIMNKVKIGATI